MKLKEFTKAKKYPYLGYSPNLIDYFLLLGFDTTFKQETASSIAKHLKDSDITRERLDYQDIDLGENKKFFPQKITYKPVVLNSIKSDFNDTIFDEEQIIKNFFPNNYTLIYILQKNSQEKEKDIEYPKNQNLILYLNSKRISQENQDEGDSESATTPDNDLSKNIMFNIYGYLFWEWIMVDNFIFFFPKVLTFVSQYSYFKYYSYLAQNITSRMTKNFSFEIPLEVQLYNIINFTPSPIDSDLKVELLINSDLIGLKNRASSKLEVVYKIQEKDDIQKKKDITIQSL